jgi:hypothetical protein
VSYGSRAGATGQDVRSEAFVIVDEDGRPVMAVYLADALST